jgi:hypothetical protein
MPVAFALLALQAFAMFAAALTRLVRPAREQI